MRDIGRGKATGTSCRRLRFGPHRLEHHISAASELPTHASRQARTFRAGSLIGKEWLHCIGNVQRSTYNVE